MNNKSMNNNKPNFPKDQPGQRPGGGQPSQKPQQPGQRPQQPQQPGQRPVTPGTPSKGPNPGNNNNNNNNKWK